MKIFAISDLHLSTAVEKPMDIFGDGWQNHFDKIRENWEENVSAEDIVLLGGDMSWGSTMDEASPDYALVDKLKGQKFVVKGNHDFYWNSLSKMRARFENFTFIQNNAFRVENRPTDETEPCDNCSKSKQKHAGIVIAGTRGWTIPSKDSDENTKRIYSRELVRLKLSLEQAKSIKQDGDLLIALLHYPPFEADYADTDFTKILEEYGVDFALYGHLHGKNVRITPRLKKNGVEYVLTSCDLINNKLVKVCEI